MSFDPSAVNQAESLQAALACLDLSLESELALYRRHRLHTSGALALPESGELFEASNPFEPESGEASVAHLSNMNALQGVSSEAGLMALSAQTGDPQDIGVERDRDSVDASASAEQEVAFAADESEEDPETLPEPYNAEAVSKPEALERFLDPSIEDYLESSEALLKHLDDSEGAIAKSSKSSKSPKSVKSAKSVRPSNPSPPKSSSPGSSALAFKVLGSLLAIALLIGVAMSILKLMTTKPREAPVPQSSVQTPLAPASTSPSAIAIAPVALKPTPTPAGSPSPTVRPAAFYAVVAPYRGDASLQRARQLVPDAFIANIEGQTRIQLAFLEDLQRAQRLVDDLKNEGFPATIVSQN
jgi:hypothetical protein